MLELLTGRKDFMRFRESLASDTSIGLVATMGNLHQGHLSLVQAALEDNDLVIVSIFVNPKQFAPHEDLDQYPRTLDQDLSKLGNLLRLQKNKRLCVFAPLTTEEVYPKDFSSSISVEHTMTKVLCAQNRPTHFSGVVTVVYELFKLIKPRLAYFGQKDYQQLLIVKEMVKKYKLPVTIKSVAIGRDENGLALSSRNQFLTPKQRSQALNLPKTLQKIAHQLKNTKDLNAITEDIHTVIQDDPCWQYLEILDAKDLSKAKAPPYVVAGAYKLGSTRLIDNVIVD